jgi:hypothetical protein
MNDFMSQIGVNIWKVIEVGGRGVVSFIYIFSDT